MTMNKVFLSGRLGKVSKTLYGEGDNVCCFFNVAVTKYNNGNEYTDWISCKTWGKNAKRFVQYAEDGLFIEVEGHLKTEEYNEQKKTSVIADIFSFYKTAPRIVYDPEKIDKEER